MDVSGWMGSNKDDGGVETAVANINGIRASCRLLGESMLATVSTHFAFLCFCNLLDTRVFSIGYRETDRQWKGVREREKQQ